MLTRRARVGSWLLVVVWLIASPSVSDADDLGARVQTFTYFATDLPEAEVVMKNPNAGAYIKFRLWGGSVLSPTNLAFQLDQNHVSGTQKRCEGADKDCDDDDDCTTGPCVYSVCTLDDSACLPPNTPDPCPNNDTCLVITDTHNVAYDCGVEFAYGDYVIPPLTTSFVNVGAGVGQMHHDAGGTCDQTCDDQGRCMMKANNQGAYITHISFDNTCWISVNSADNDLQFMNTPSSENCGTVCP